MFGDADIHTLTDFCRKPDDHIKRIQESKHPEILTVNGKAAAVLQDVESYEKLAELADYADSILHIRRAVTEEGRPLNEFTKEFEARHGIKR